MRNYLGEFEVEELFEIKDIGVTMPVEYSEVAEPPNMMK